MEQTILSALINNAAILLVLTFIYELTYRLPSRYNRRKPFISGLMIAAICIGVMLMPFKLRPGLVYDTRTILLSVAGLTFGLIPTAIAACAAAVFRIITGGPGVLPGLATILTSSLIGLAWRRFTPVPSRKWRWLNILLMGITVHAVMLACMLLLPYPDRLSVIGIIALPVMVIYPIASVLLGLLLLQQRDYRSIQDQLKKSEERFRLLFDKAPLGYQSLDADGNIIDVNEQWLDTFGYSRKEAIGKWFGDLFAPEHRDSFRHCLAALKEQGYVQVEHEVLHRSGRSISLSFVGKARYGADGAFQQTHCILQDITKQKTAEENLRVSEEKHRRLYETMALGIVYQAADGAIISANPAAERILGLTFDQMQGKTSMDPGWRAVREDGSALLGSEHPAMVALRTGKPFGPFLMGVYQPKIDDTVWLSINAIPLFRPGEPSPYQVYATFQDITAERRARQNYQQLFHEMVDAFALHEIICDEAGTPVDYRFLTVNPAFEQMTGLKAEDIQGRTVLDVLPDTEPFWIETYGKVALTGEPVRFGSHSAASGKYYEVSAYCPSLNQFACTFSDVTQRVRAEEETGRILSRLRSLMDNSPSPIVILDETGKIIEVSETTKNVLGLSENALPAAAPPQITEKIRRILQQAPDQGSYIESIDVYEFGGRKRSFESRLFPIHSLSLPKRLFGYLAIDVTERRMAEQALKESEEKYSSYISNSPFGIFVVDGKGQYVEANRSGAAITGYSIQQLLKMNIRDITAEESLPSALQHFGNMKITGHMSAELKFVHQDGSIRWWTVDAVRLSEDRYLGFSADITEKKNAEADLLHISIHDYLTGLYNRRYFESEMERADTESQLPLSVMIGDINGVKLVNDAFGHSEGDRLIAQSAKIIAGCSRPGDTVARIGGDEFAILMPKTDNVTALGVLTDIKAALAALNANGPEEKFEYSVSLGFATKRKADEDIQSILRIAEEYMYQRKLLEHNSSHSKIISSIKAAMIAKNQETEDHAERMAFLSRIIAIDMNLSAAEQDRLELLAALHDIGKVGISERILIKQGSLNEDEWVEIKRHPEIGYRIAISTPELIPIAESILCHHERWDGQGYPQGLGGETIPLLSRILAVVDAYDAMTHDRPYRKAMTHEEAVAEITANASKQFDPRIVDVFLQKLKERKPRPDDRGTE